LGGKPKSKKYKITGHKMKEVHTCNLTWTGTFSGGGGGAKKSKTRKKLAGRENGKGRCKRNRWKTKMKRAKEAQTCSNGASTRKKKKTAVAGTRYLGEESKSGQGRSSYVNPKERLSAGH